VLIGDADAATIDVGDMNNLPNEDCINSGSAYLHEAMEQFYIQAEGKTINAAHNKASGVEGSVGMYDIPVIRPIDNDKGTLSVPAQHKLTGVQKTITINVKNNNIVKPN
ncbi:MAG: hypothetical protein J6Y78_08735, partial [Paludibacteraceae bacterium]|nr:hypothetical protein [Paludibacteraceae bacterium]